MRKRTNMSGLVCHSSDGKNNFSNREKCVKQLYKLERLINDGYKLVDAKKSGTPKEVIVSVFGGKLKMTFTEYQEHGKDLKVLMEIF